MNRSIPVCFASLGTIVAGGCGAGAANAPASLASAPRCDVPLWRSEYMIHAVLREVIRSGVPVGGAGIVRIDETAPNTYAVFVPHEERTDVLTYVLDIDDRCKVKIVRRMEATLDAKDSANSTVELDER
jgi:hypothetical protein